MMGSRNCPLRLQASITAQSQTVSRQPVPIIPSTTVSITASIPLEATYASVNPLPSSQISIGIQLSPPRVSLQPELQPQLSKQLSPDRPEVLIQAYLAEKDAWLSKHPTIRPSEYRKARKWKTPRPKILKEQVFYMPKERRNLAGIVIADKANWTNEEIIVWLANEEKREQDEYNRLNLEFTENSNRHTENRPRDIWARLQEEHARESEQYIL
jgi:hypothetical protein